MISASIVPVSPPLAGRFVFQIAGVSAARMSSKSPPLFTLSGANSAMSRSPAQSSRFLMSNQLLAPLDSPPAERPAPYRPLVRTSTHDPFNLYPSSLNLRSPFFSAASTSSVSGAQAPPPQRN